jgi:nitrite reductase/ring-hydroxylating ferredoxin subunit
MNFVRIARVEEVPAGEGRVFEAGGVRVLLVRLRDGIVALQPTCPHRGCEWSGAKLDAEILACPMCRYRYSARTGLNPATTACHVNQSTAEYHYRNFPEGYAAVYEVRVRGDEVTVAARPRPFRKVLG